MNFLFKIEDLLNNALLWLGQKLVQLWNKICPSWMKTVWLASKLKLTELKNFRPKLKPRDLLKIKVDYMGVFAAALDAGRKAFQNSRQHSPLKAVLSVFSVPFVYLFQWAANLKPAHFIILFVFTTASVLSVVGIVIQSQRMLQPDAASRAPASADVAYGRPAYHKIDQRVVSFNNVKIPVYVTELNELRALNVDLSVVTSNRATKRWLEKNEFQMRDHLVQTLEPVLPSFPMTEEGRAMITDKLKAEINFFLANHNVEGEIKEARLVHILAH